MWSLKLWLNCRALAWVITYSVPLTFYLFFVKQLPPFLILSTQGLVRFFLVFFKIKLMMLRLDTSQKGGKDVGQNLQSKSHSKNRRKWVTQLWKEGHFLKLSLWCLFVWAPLLSVTVGSLFSSKDFSPAKGREHSMPYSFCSLSLSCEFLSAPYPSNKIPSAVFLFSYFRCPSTFSCMWIFFSGPGNFWYYSASETWFYDAKWIRNTGRRRHYVEMLSLNLLDFLFCVSFSAFVWPSWM